MPNDGFGSRLERDMIKFLGELKWLVPGLLLPVVGVHVTYIAVTSSPVPLLDRLLLREDACPYGSCLIRGFVSYLLITAGRVLRRMPVRPR